MDKSRVWNIVPLPQNCHSVILVLTFEGQLSNWNMYLGFNSCPDFWSSEFQFIEAMPSKMLW